MDIFKYILVAVYVIVRLLVMKARDVAFPLVDYISNIPEKILDSNSKTR